MTKSKLENVIFWYELYHHQTKNIAYTKLVLITVKKRNKKLYSGVKVKFSAGFQSIVERRC